jgi:hypothetical protein
MLLLLGITGRPPARTAPLLGRPPARTASADPSHALRDAPSTTVRGAAQIDDLGGRDPPPRRTDGAHVVRLPRPGPVGCAHAARRSGPGGSRTSRLVPRLLTDRGRDRVRPPGRSARPLLPLPLLAIRIVRPLLGLAEGVMDGRWRGGHRGRPCGGGPSGAYGGGGRLPLRFGLDGDAAGRTQQGDEHEGDGPQVHALVNDGPGERTRPEAPGGGLHGRCRFARPCGGADGGDLLASRRRGALSRNRIRAFRGA